ncbi:MAG: hypothetical protein JWM25_1612 [Thermoleophilia bacterium]|nr:hypothetical protein [Thermoleophilia bacterium]MCZ4497027.1 hypothetical protein [Thermoleophilia bacterium]
MATYAQSAPSNRSGGTDVAAWALIALVVAMICAAAGWAIARQDNPGRDDLQRNAMLASQEGSLQGQADGYKVGAVAGRKEAALRNKQQADSARAAATRDGYDAGVLEGRNRAMARANGEPYFSSGAAAGGTLPGYEDILARLGGDVPGYSDSAYSSSGFGTTATTPYAANGSFGASMYDDYGF